jgi:acyl-CoA dehydrogenase
MCAPRSRPHAVEHHPPHLHLPVNVWSSYRTRAEGPDHPGISVRGTAQLGRFDPVETVKARASAPPKQVRDTRAFRPVSAPFPAGTLRGEECRTPRRHHVGRGWDESPGCRKRHQVTGAKGRTMEGFEPTEEIRLLRDRVRRFVDEEVVPVERDLLSATEADTLSGLMASAKAQGLWALGHPSTMGGGGLPFLAYVYVNEVIGRSLPAEVALGTHSLQDALMLARYASEEQRRRWLAPLVEGTIYASIGMTEPEVAGSDPKLMRATATPTKSGWLLDGHKWFVRWADRAAVTTVLAKTDPTALLHRQYSAFLVPSDAPGYTVERLLSVMGDDTSIYGELRLRRVEVSADQMLGERGEGFTIAQMRLQPARVFDCMRWLGQAERAFELMCSRASERYVHGSLLREKGELQHDVAESAAQIHAARLMVLDTARKLDAGNDARVETSLIKFFTARMLHEVLDRAIQVHGAAGVSGDLPLEAMYRAARSARIYDGPDEVHRMLVARELLDDLEGHAPWI